MKEEAGYLIGNNRMEAEGKLENTEGKVQKTVGDIKAVRAHDLEGQQRTVSSSSSIVSNSSTTDKVEGTFHRVSREFSAVSC